MNKILLLLAVLGCGKSVAKKVDKKVVAANEKVLFEFTDAKGDDKGPGSYAYPKDKVFKKGCFDILSVDIREVGQNYKFVIEVNADFKNDWTLPGGWDVQMFDIYLDLGQEQHRQAMKGRNVKFSSTWDKAIVVSPLRKDRVRKEIEQTNLEVYDDVSELENLTQDIVVPDLVTTEMNYISIEVSKKKLPGLSRDLKKIQVLSMGVNPFGEEGIAVRRVKEHSSQWSFGGGSYYGSHPNVIDMLGDNKKLGSFQDNGVSKVYATIDLVDVSK